MESKISAIVLCWNHLEDITKPFIDSFLKNTPESNLELILMDNGSTDGTGEYLKSLKDKRVKVIRSSVNLGFGGGNNLAYKHATGDIVVFLNNDVIFHKLNWTTTLKGNIKEGVAVGQQLVTNNSATNFLNQSTPYLNGWCVAATKKDIDKVLIDGNVFDPVYGLAYFEDVDLSYRLFKAGCILREVEFYIEHLGSKSSDQLDQGTAFKLAQAAFVNKRTWMKLEDDKKYRFVFMAGGNNYGFIDSDYEGKGVGGAEASLILLARELAKAGHWVDVYNNTEVVGKFGGVNYYNTSQFNPSQYCDLFVLFRNYHPSIWSNNAARRIFWSCDQATDSAAIWQGAIFPNVDEIFCISQYHKNYMSKVYGVSESKIRVVDLGVKWEDYKNEVEKVPGKAIFCSVPQRGLMKLLPLLPEIKRRIPWFNLVITSDYRLWGGADPNNLKELEACREFDYITFLGKVPREELVKHQLEAEVMTYPCIYDECFCISAMECIAAGAIPVTTNIGAMFTTVYPSGTVINGRPGEAEYDETFVGAVEMILKDKEMASKQRKLGRKRVEKHYTWKYLASTWVKYIQDLEGEV